MKFNVRIELHRQEGTDCYTTAMTSIPAINAGIISHIKSRNKTRTREEGLCREGKG